MKNRNPWIDPRVEQVRTAEARDYLRNHGWKPLPAEQANLDLFESPGGDEQVVAVPLAEEGRDYVQRVIELIGGVALAEGRYAGDVLSDVLRLKGATTNGVREEASATVPR